MLGKLLSKGIQSTFIFNTRLSIFVSGHSVLRQSKRFSVRFFVALDEDSVLPGGLATDACECRDNRLSDEGMCGECG